jgi:hypothetical protein
MWLNEIGNDDVSPSAAHARRRVATAVSWCSGPSPTTRTVRRTHARSPPSRPTKIAWGIPLHHTSCARTPAVVPRNATRSTDRQSRPPLLGLLQHPHFLHGEGMEPLSDSLSYKKPHIPLVRERSSTEPTLPPPPRARSSARSRGHPTPRVVPLGATQASTPTCCLVLPLPWPDFELPQPRCPCSAAGAHRSLFWPHHRNQPNPGELARHPSVSLGPLRTSFTAGEVASSAKGTLETIGILHGPKC